MTSKAPICFHQNTAKAEDLEGSLKHSSGPECPLLSCCLDGQKATGPSAWVVPGVGCLAAPAAGLLPFLSERHAWLPGVTICT